MSMKLIMTSLKIVAKEEWLLDILKPTLSVENVSKWGYQRRKDIDMFPSMTTPIIIGDVGDSREISFTYTSFYSGETVSFLEEGVCDGESKTFRFDLSDVDSETELPEDIRLDAMCQAQGKEYSKLTKLSGFAIECELTLASVPKKSKL